MTYSQKLKNAFDDLRKMPPEKITREYVLNQVRQTAKKYDLRFEDLLARVDAAWG